jgi:hypothetical protein
MSNLRTICTLLCIAILCGCHCSIVTKRQSEKRCPTDVRQKHFSLCGEDALFQCPCGPDSDYYGMKPTCWRPWPTSGAEWRDTYCGPPALCNLPGCEVPFQAIPTEQMPAASIPQEAIDPIGNPFGAHLIQPLQQGPATTEPGPAAPSDSPTPLPTEVEEQFPPEDTSSPPEDTTSNTIERPSQLLFPPPEIASNPSTSNAVTKTAIGIEPVLDLGKASSSPVPPSSGAGHIALESPSASVPVSQAHVAKASAQVAARITEIPEDVSFNRLRQVAGLGSVASSRAAVEPESGSDSVSQGGLTQGEIQSVLQEDYPKPVLLANHTQDASEQSKLQIVQDARKSVPSQALFPGPRVPKLEAPQAGLGLPAPSSSWKIAGGKPEKPALFLDISSVLDMPQKSTHAQAVHYQGESNQSETTITIAPSKSGGALQQVIPVQATEPSVDSIDDADVKKDQNNSNSLFIKALLKHAAPLEPASTTSASQLKKLPGVSAGPGL